MTKVSAIALRLAGLAGARVAGIDALLNGYAHPCQRRSQQEITDRD
jgi:hypothetical protein